MLISDSGPTPGCIENWDLFFGADEDGRREIARTDREELCKLICLECPFRLKCLERALVHNEQYGVWGGMGEGERRSFQRHIKLEGYGREIPGGRELYASLKAFDRHRTAKEERRNAG